MNAISSRERRMQLTSIGVREAEFAVGRATAYHEVIAQCPINSEAVNSEIARDLPSSPRALKGVVPKRKNRGCQKLTHKNRFSADAQRS